LRLAAARDGYTLTVRDAGPGLPEDELERVFEPFHRVASDRARDSGGAGLGLAIAARVMRAHGGRIEARNLPGDRPTGTQDAPGGLEMQLWWPAAGSAERDSAPAVRPS
jgi:signal transduction histidine kinase